MKVITKHPIAYESYDHMFPKGTANDNNHKPIFVQRMEEHYRRKIIHMDLGCSGGGLVKDFIDRGHRSVGVEGSDYSKRNQRAEWATIPDSLFTADITKPFHIVDNNGVDIVLCDLITAWDVMEHITKEALPGLFKNIHDNLVDGGMFICSIATFPDEPHHVTLEPKEWWVEQFKLHGLRVATQPCRDDEMLRTSTFFLTLMKV